MQNTNSLIDRAKQEYDKLRNSFKELIGKLLSILFKNKRDKDNYKTQENNTNTKKTDSVVQDGSPNIALEEKNNLPTENDSQNVVPKKEIEEDDDEFYDALIGDGEFYDALTGDEEKYIGIEDIKYLFDLDNLSKITNSSLKALQQQTDKQILGEYYQYLISKLNATTGVNDLEIEFSGDDMNRALAILFNAKSVYFQGKHYSPEDAVKESYSSIGRENKEFHFMLNLSDRTDEELKNKINSKNGEKILFNEEKRKAFDKYINLAQYIGNLNSFVKDFVIPIAKQILSYSESWMMRSAIIATANAFGENIKQDASNLLYNKCLFSYSLEQPKSISLNTEKRNILKKFLAEVGIVYKNFIAPNIELPNHENFIVSCSRNNESTLATQYINV
jgi:hypothetical protein